MVLLQEITAMDDPTMGERTWLADASQSISAEFFLLCHDQTEDVLLG